MYWRERWLIIVFTIVATAVTFLVTSLQPVRYSASASFAVNRINPEKTPDYQFDGYYALQAADLYSQTVVSWFTTPAVLNEMYQQAKIDPEIVTLNSLPSRFHVRRLSAQNINVRLTERTEQRAQKLGLAVSEVLKNKTASLNQDPSGRALFEILSTDPVVVQVRPNPWLFGGLALVLSFGLSLMLAALRYYLRS